MTKTYLPYHTYYNISSQGTSLSIPPLISIHLVRQKMQKVNLLLLPFEKLQLGMKLGIGSGVLPL